MTESLVLYQVGPSPAGVKLRLAFWWALALLLSGLVARHLFILRDRGALLSLPALVEISLLSLFWAYGVASFKLVVLARQVWKIETTPEAVRIHYINKRSHELPYRNLTEVILHFPDMRCAYDGMELAFARDDQGTFYTGRCQCPGEVMEALALSVRLRIKNATGRDAGDAGADRLLRRSQAAASQRRQRQVAAGIVLPLVLLGAVILLHLFRDDRALYRQGRDSEATVTRVINHPLATTIFYDYETADATNLHGKFTLPRRTLPAERLESGATIRIRYDTGHPKRSVPHIAGLRFPWIGYILFAVLLAGAALIACLALSGRHIAFFRGKIILLPTGAMEEDRLGGG